MAGTNTSSDERDGDWAEFLPSVILANPQMGENIGASARAMKNCGLTTLHLVDPRDGWPNPAAEAMSSGGSDILDRADVYATTAEAAAPYTMIAATTARKRGMAKDILTPREAGAMLFRHAKAGGKTALLFGGERSGLDNDDVALADIIITVPLNPQFSSLNLAQAVLLTGWECRMAALMDQDLLIDDRQDNPASSQDKQFFFGVLEEVLGQGGFFGNDDMKAVVMRNIMAMFGRAELTEQDIRTLHGMVKSIRRAGAPD
ncbi:MAG: RNA methyltransferase [Alphaproteobacteria bacterium]|nr:RNA methyltransferase [Alphaproteobacteria bacterium]